MTQTTSEEIEHAILYKNFAESLAVLTKKGYEIISLPQNARLRIQQGCWSHISEYENWVREGVICRRREKPKLARNSPILLSTREEIQAFRDGNESHPTQELIEQALIDSIDFPEKNITIPTGRFGANDLTAYAFGDVAEEYGLFLREAGVINMPVYAVSKHYVDSQIQPFVRQIFFRGLGERSGLSCGRYLDMGGLCGIKKTEN